MLFFNVIISLKFDNVVVLIIPITITIIINDADNYNYRLTNLRNVFLISLRPKDKQESILAQRDVTLALSS